VAVIERLASTLPPISADARAFYTAPEPLAPGSGDAYSWDVVTEEQGVKVRRATRFAARGAWRAVCCGPRCALRCLR